MLGLGKDDTEVEFKVVTIDPTLMRQVSRRSGSDEDDEVVLMMVLMTSQLL